MSLKTATVRYGSEPEVGYLVYPERAAGPLPAVVVLQEAWGVDAHIEDVTRRFAGAGYAALAPDLYAHQGTRLPGLEDDRLAELQAFMNTAPPTVWMDAKARDEALASRPEAERARIRGSFEAMLGRLSNQSAMLPKVLQAVSFLREECDVTRGQKIASVGFCMGGGLSALLACHDSALAAAVVFYGSPPPADLVPRLACPVLGLFGSLDTRLVGLIPEFERAAKQAGKPVENVIYEGAHHAFFNDSRPTYDAKASRDAFLRTLRLLRDSLGA